MDIEGQTNSAPTQESKERISPTRCVFLQLGGTWLMQTTEKGRTAYGNLDDDALIAKERELGLYDVFERNEVNRREKELMHWLYQSFINTAPYSGDAGDYLHFCPEFRDYLTGPYYPLYSGDSCNFRNALIAATTKYIIDLKNEQPNIVTTSGMGTDLLDVGPPKQIDALIFDTDLSSLLFFAANDPAESPNSDAPHNLRDLALVANSDLTMLMSLMYKESDPTKLKDSILGGVYHGSGVYEVFAGNVYHAADIVKLDPFGKVARDQQITFYSPHQTMIPVETLSHRKLQTDFQWGYCRRAPEGHISRRLRLDNLFNALTSIHSLDLGQLNDPGKVVGEIIDPSYKAIVVATHSMGNVDYLTRNACVEAVKRGKKVVVCSRTLAGDVNTIYSVGLLSANENSHELGNSKDKLIVGGKLHPMSAKALLARSIMEEQTNSRQIQQLFDRYSMARFGHLNEEGQYQSVRDITWGDPRLY